MNKPVIAVVGETGSGKTTVAEILQRRGFVTFSGGDILRELSASFGLNQERETLINMGNKLREVFGPEILMRAAMRQMEQAGGEMFLFESIRHPGEVGYLKSELGAYVVGVIMSDEKRFELMSQRSRAGDPKDWEEFMELKRREYDNPLARESDLNVAACLRLADVVIPNEGTVKELELRIDEVLASRGVLEGNRMAERR